MRFRVGVTDKAWFERLRELYTPENIRERLATRDFLEKLRETGVQTGGPAPLDNTDRKRFADQLLTRLKNPQNPA